MTDLQNQARSDAIKAVATSTARDLLALVHELGTLMVQETGHLRARRLPEFGALQDRKASLSRRYGDLTTKLRECATHKQTLDPKLKDELRQAIEAMQQVMVENQLTIQAAQQLNQRLAKAIADAVREQRNPGGAYSAAGQVVMRDNAPPLSVQIDRRL